MSNKEKTDNDLIDALPFLSLLVFQIASSAVAVGLWGWWGLLFYLATAILRPFAAEFIAWLWAFFPLVGLVAPGLLPPGGGWYWALPAAIGWVFFAAVFVARKNMLGELN